MFVPKIMLYIASAMTHLAPEIRGDSTKFLAWLLDVNKDLVLRNGGWAKGLRGLIGVLGWGTAKDNGCISGGGTSGSVAKGKIRMQHLNVLREFLSVGLVDDFTENINKGGDKDGLWRMGSPHWTTHLHMVPSKSSQANAFSYLGLFSVTQNSSDEDTGVEDTEARKRWLIEGAGQDALESLRRGVEGVTKEGGEIGRLGAKILAVMDDSMHTTEEDE